jgi:tRNA pseudouridine65 synthase
VAVNAGLDETWLRLLEQFAWKDAYETQITAWKAAIS